MRNTIQVCVLVAVACLWPLDVQSTEIVLPTIDNVGPAAMPNEIAPVEAPFELPPLNRPHFSDTEIRLDEEQGETGKLITRRLQAAIDSLSASGGGRVALPAGEWLTGRLALKSGVELHLEQGAVLRFSGQIEDYLPPVFTRCEGLEMMGLGGMIYAHNQERIAITGSGELRGPDSGPLREARAGLVDDLVDLDAPPTERVFDGQEGRHYLRPNFITFVSCRDVLIEGVTLQNSPMWNVVPVYCDRVVVRGITVNSRGVVNGDGVNIVSCRNVLVEYCSMNTGDDCYAVKAGRGRDGVRVNKPSERIVIRYCHAKGGFGGFTCGSETGGGIQDIYVHDCVFEDVDFAVYFKTRRPRGGGGQRILVERIVCNTKNHAVFFDMIGLPMYVGKLADRLPKRAITPLTPFYRDVTVRDIKGTSSDGEAFKIKGIPESPARNVTLERVDIASRGFVYLIDAAGVKLVDCRFAPEQPVLKLLGSRDVEFLNCQFKTPAGQPIKIEAPGSEAESLRFENCDPPALSDE